MDQFVNILKLPQRHLYAVLIVSAIVAMIPDSIETALHIPDSARGYKYAAFVIAITCGTLLIVSAIGNAIDSRRVAESDRNAIQLIKQRCNRLTKQEQAVVRAFIAKYPSDIHVDGTNGVIQILIQNEILIPANGLFDPTKLPCSINLIAAEYLTKNRVSWYINR